MRWRGIVTLIVLARKGPHGAQVLGNRRTKLEEPAPYPLVGNIQTPLRKKILHIPIAQSEPGIEPNGASNDFRWKAVTFEGDGVHPKRLHRNHQIEIRALNVTMPSPRLPGRQELQRPADPRGLRSRLPALSLLKAIGVYSRTSEAGEESAYGTAAEIAVSQTRPPVATCAIGPLTFRTEARRSIDRELPGEARWWHAFGRCANSLSRRPGERVWVAPCSIACRCRSRFVPTQGSRQSASLAFGVCHSALPLSARPVTGGGRRFPTASGFGPPFAGERKTLTNP